MLDRFFLSILILTFTVTFVALMAITFVVSSAKCDQYGMVTGFETKYHLFGDRCYVNTPDGWVLQDQVYVEQGE